MAIAFVQGPTAGGANTTSGAAATVAITLNAASTVGNLMILLLFPGSTQTVSTITGGAAWGATDVFENGSVSGGGGAGIWSAICTSSVSSISVTFSGTATNFIEYYEFSGVQNVTDGTSANGTSTAGTAVTSNSISTTNANDLLIGALDANTAVSAFEAGWTGDPSSLKTSEYNIVAATSSYAATFTIASGVWVAVVAAFKASVSSGPAGGTGTAAYPVLYPGY